MREKLIYLKKVIRKLNIDLKLSLSWINAIHLQTSKIKSNQINKSIYSGVNGI